MDTFAHERRRLDLDGSGRRFFSARPPAVVRRRCAWRPWHAPLGEPKDPEKSAAELITPAAARAIERGLSLLATRQDDDGSFRSGGYSRNVAICALAGMAFMSGGSTPGRGPYGRNVDRCIDFILANTQESGFINVPNASSHGPMYGHGFATLFLAECYGMTRRGRHSRKAVQGRATDRQHAEQRRGLALSAACGATPTSRSRFAR